MYKQVIKYFLLASSVLLLAACDGFFEKDNTPTPSPLVNFTPEIKPRLLWSTNAGAGADDEFLRISPAISQTSIFTASTNGTVTSINKQDGSKYWQVGTGVPITTSPGIGQGLVVVSSRKGDIVALSQIKGNIVWRTSVTCEILAQPAISNDIVVIKGTDGHVHGLSIKDGHELWLFQQAEPSLILRGSSAPLIRNHGIIVGFANGNLTKLSLGDGQLVWSQTIATPEGAFAIQRMIDIDADPIAYNNRIYAATYQGKIASLESASGKELWSQDISSYTGMVADENTVYISDATGSVWAFNATSGGVNWRQTRLLARVLSGPGDMGRYIVVGDAQGYLHWINKADGHFAAREYLRSPVYAAPIVENNVLYALTNNGKLFAYILS